MYRTALRSSARAIRGIRQPLHGSSRRLASTASPADKPRSWKGSALRVGAAVAVVYWYNTSPVFADEIPPQTVPAPPVFSDADMQTVDAMVDEKRKLAEKRAQATLQEQVAAAEPAQMTTGLAEADPLAPAAEEEDEGSDRQAAFNPETGEINWDCPCLGGMADGPCGEEFKAAFSCFVYSQEEPKGMDCIEKFQGMQTCFRQYPEIYGAELADDEDAEGAAAFDADSDPEGTPTEKAATQSPEEPKEPKENPAPTKEAELPAESVAVSANSPTDSSSAQPTPVEEKSEEQRPEERKPAAPVEEHQPKEKSELKEKSDAPAS